MADHSIMFRIGSVFTGEGFKKAENTVKTMNAEMKKGMGAVSQLGGVLGQMDSSASKAATAMTGMIQALMSMNATVIISQAAVMALNFVTSELVAKYDEMKRKADEIHAAMEKTFSSTLSERMSSIKSEVASISEEFERITKEANAFQAALNGLESAKMSGGILSLQVEKLNAMLEAHSEAERANIEASYNLKIAIQKSADTEATWQLKIEDAEKARVDNAKRLGIIYQQLEKVSAERRSLEATMLVAKASNDKHWVDIQKQVNALKEQENQLEEKRLSTIAENEVLQLKEQKVKQDAVNAQESATAEIINAELAEKRLTEAKNARELKEKVAAEAADQKAAADLIDAQETKSAAEIQKEVNDSANKLKAAQDLYAKKLEEYYSFDIIAEAARKQGQSSKSGMGKAGLLPVDVQKSIQTTVADTRVESAISSGMVNTVKDADRLQRDTMREVRDKISKNQGQIIREQQRYKRLQKIDPEKLCSADRDFMEKYNKIITAAEQRKESLKKAEEDSRNQKENLKEMKKELEDINKKLEKVGLK